MKIKITKELADFNTSKLGNNRRVLVVQFPNCVSTTSLKPFKWLPTYEQVEAIKNGLEEIEAESWGLK